jgi:hypothetical protein
MEKVAKEDNDITVCVVIEVTHGVWEKKNLLDDIIGSSYG